MADVRFEKKIGQGLLSAKCVKWCSRLQADSRLFIPDACKIRRE